MTSVWNLYIELPDRLKHTSNGQPSNDQDSNGLHHSNGQASFQTDNSSQTARFDFS
ncbi:hypothetical protein HanHA300_Chr02g0060211 [Helianthus annuus]|nr:hypothetical protein HanHA300_Chr02g0060211 [Helianthus annuus]KAJ0619207.1 hypothetical protein HanHA89_Chr02g0068761 [Helianthus annuus]KAJ0777659.1 hypothetical protein HanLR1_Chr02g0063011 [Helianthus annuus]KAJ0786684.1 hypothetical protein HanOQP8_Chr02g0074081 [Helianthus annuus]